MSVSWHLELMDKLPETPSQLIIHPQYWVGDSRKKKGKNVSGQSQEKHQRKTQISPMFYVMQ